MIGASVPTPIQICWVIGAYNASENKYISPLALKGTYSSSIDPLHLAAMEAALDRGRSMLEASSVVDGISTNALTGGLGTLPVGSYLIVLG